MREPFVAGNYARAWSVKWDANDLQNEACLGCYLIEGNFHPFWTQWCISVVNLRDVPGFPPAIKKKPEYTHELMIVAANPDIKLNPDIRPDSGWQLMPPDVVEQFQVPSDANAVDMLGKFICFICNGELSPDSDFREVWTRIVQAEATKCRLASDRKDK
jgi:hypothetical protein